MSTRQQRPVRTLIRLIALTRNLTTAVILLRGWFRLQVEWPPERAERLLRLRIRVGKSTKTIWIRDNQSDLICLLEILIEHCYTPAIMACQTPPQVIYDIGANIGIASAYLQDHFPSARIVAFEPGIPELSVLARNVDSRVLILPVALTDGHLRIAEFRVSSRASGGQHLAGHWAESENRFPFASTPVVAGSLRDIALSIGLPSPDIVKLDIEGGELPVLRDLVTLPIPPMVVVAELHSADIETEAASIFRDFGYRMTNREDGRQGTSIMTFLGSERTA